MLPKLGVLAGSGDIPARLISACRSSGREVFVVALNGETDPKTVEDCDHVWQDIAAVGGTVDALKSAGCEDVVLIGPLHRPQFSALKPDWQGVKLLPRILKAARVGDDALLTVVVAFLEEQGFRVVGADEILTDMAAPFGNLGAHTPSDEDRADIARGVEVGRALGAADVGQAVVVRDGVVLAVEAAEGTDAMLARCIELRGDGAGGVLVKLPKPGQERRVDLPTIGTSTVERAIAAGLHGIAVEVGGALVVDRENVVARADAAGLFVTGIEPGAGS